MNPWIKVMALVLIGAMLTACSTADKMMKDDKAMAKDKMMKDGKAMAKDKMMPFGGPSDTDYAASLWQALVAANLAGPNAVSTKPYQGQHPHGAVLTNVEASLTLNGNTGPVIVKSNFGGDGVSINAVNTNPSKYLGAVTVMYKRAGYDPDNSDWFWAKYLPDGSLDKNPKGMQLAGRVAKVDPPAGCIGCHSAAPGGDMVFTNNRYAQ